MRAKVEKVVRNCINCMLAERKQGKQEGFLHPIEKGELPLDTYHVDHLGPVSTDTAEVVNRLGKQAVILGNPRRIVSDRGTAFTSHAFAEYCKEENIQHVTTTTGMPRANGQVERVNRTLIPLLTKLATPRSEECHRYVHVAQKFLNATPR